MQSLESILSQVDKRFEIIVVDNQSNDGSLDVLRHYERAGKIKLMIRRCSRGLGRQICIRNSKGKYIITQMDMDDVFEPNINQILKIYHTHFEGYLLLIQGVPGMTIAPRTLIDKVGGYRYLNYLEDRDLYYRVAQIGYFRFLKSFRIVAYSIRSKRNNYKKIRNSFLYFREAFRIGQGPNFRILIRHLIRELRAKNYIWAIGFPGLLIIATMAFIIHWFYSRFHNKFIRSFNYIDYIVKI